MNPGIPPKDILDKGKDNTPAGGSESSQHESQHSGVLKINLDGVYQGDLHTLKWLEIINLSDEEILVKLKSNLGNQIAFQLSNENLVPEGEPPPLSSKEEIEARVKAHVSSDGVQPLFLVFVPTAVQDNPNESSHNFPGKNHNQLFNNVNHISEIELSPKEARRFLLAFLPGSNSTRPSRRKHKTYEALDSEISEVYDFCEINGLLFFMGYIKKKSPTIENINQEAENNLASTSRPDYKLIAKFRSRVCKSLMHTDIGENGIVFPDCTVNNLYYKDFTIYNCSAIKLYWTLNSVDLFNRRKEAIVNFIDPETGMELDFSPILPFFKRSVRVTFLPKEAKEFNYEFQLENVTFSENFIPISLHSVVHSDSSNEPVVIVPNNTLDFGTCITGKWIRKTLTLRSESEVPIEVIFSSDADNVRFYLKDFVLQTSEYPQNEHRLDEWTHVPDTRLHADNSFDVSLDSEDIKNVSISVQNDQGHSSHSSQLSDSILKRNYEEGCLRTFHDRVGDVMYFLEYALSKTFISGELPDPTIEHNDDSRSSSIHERSEDELEEKYTSINEKSKSPLDAIISRKKSEVKINDEQGIIEEIVLRPGTKRVVEVMYMQKLDARTPDFRGGKITKRSFKILIKYSLEGNPIAKTKTIRCKAYTCTSFIQVEPDSIDFGDVNTGTSKEKMFKVKNQSSIPAKFCCRCTSKTISIPKQTYIIPSNEFLSLSMTISPKKANPDDQKVVNIVNLLNVSDSQKLNVRSTNISMSCDAFHSLFYRVLLPNPGNHIDFGITLSNSSVVRRLRIFNISKGDLTLSLSSTLPDEIETYIISPESGNNNACCPTGINEIRERSIERIHIQNTRGLTYIPSNKDGIFQEYLINTENTAEVFRSPFLKVLPSNHPDYKPFLYQPSSSIDINYKSKDCIAKLGTTKNSYSKPNSYAKRLTNRVDSLDLFLSDKQKDALLSIFGGNLKDGGPNKGSVSFENTRKQQSLPRLSCINQKNLDLDKNTDSNPFILKSKIDNIGNLSAPNNKSTEGESSSSGFATKTKNSQKEEENLSKEKSVQQDSAFFRNDGLTTEFLLFLLEMVTGCYPLNFLSKDQIRLYVRSIMYLKMELLYAIKYGRLKKSSILKLGPGEEKQVILIYTPRPTSNTASELGKIKVDNKLIIKIDEFDRSIQHPLLNAFRDHIDSQILNSEINLKFVRCSSTIRLSQMNINFGYINRHEVHRKSITVINNSDIPILYSIRKSGSIASGDILFAENVGIIPPLGSKRIGFKFKSSLSGSFHESISVDNILDPENSQKFSVKAIVRERDEFIVSSRFIDFGTTLVGKRSSEPKYITISNTNFKYSRSVDITVKPRDRDIEDFDVEFLFKKIESQTNILPEGRESDADNPLGESNIQTQDPVPKPKLMLTKEIEEKIERLEAKLERAKRKGRRKTEESINEELQKLRAGVDLHNEDYDDVDEISINPEKNAGDKSNTECNSTHAKKTESKSDKMYSTSESLCENYNKNKRANTINNEKGAFPNTQLLTYRRGLNRVTFSIAPRVVQPIAIYLIFKIKKSESSSHTHEDNIKTPNCAFSDCVSNSIKYERIGEVPVTGNFEIHEHKNRDIIKNLHYIALIVFNNTNPQLLGDNSNCQKEVQNQNSLDKEPLGSRSAINTGKLKSSEGGDELFLGGNIPPSIQPTLNEDDGNDSCKNNKPFFVSHDFLDLGTVTIDTEKNCCLYLTPYTPQKHESEFKILVEKSHKFDLDFDQTGVISSEKKKIKFRLIPRSHGRAEFAANIVFKENIPDIKVTFTFYSVLPSYISFPSLTGKEVDFGYCFVERKSGYSYTTKLQVKNISNYDIHLSAESNLSHQCLVILDPQIDKNVEYAHISAQSTIDVFVVLKPKLFINKSFDDNVFEPENTRASIKSGKPVAIKGSDKYPTENTRFLIGGIKFTAYMFEGSQGLPENNCKDGDHMCAVSAETIMFTAVIGVSLLRLSTQFINFGTISSLEPLEGSFKVSNLEPKLPLSYSVEKGSEGIEIYPYNVSVVPKTENSNNKEESSEVIRFRLNPAMRKFESSFIVVKNLKNSDQNEKIFIWAFLDPHTLDFNIPDSEKCIGSSYMGSTHDAYVNAQRIPDQLVSKSDPYKPILLWENIYIGTISNCFPRYHYKDFVFAKGSCDLAYNQMKTFQVVNRKSSVFYLRFKSNLKLSVFFSVGDFGRHIPRSNRKYIRAFCKRSKDSVFFNYGSSKLEGNGCATISVASPRLMRSEKTLGLLNNLTKVTQNGVLYAEDISTSEIVAAAYISSTYCISKFKLEPRFVNLGEVGYTNNWKDIAFSFTVENLSEFVFQYKLNLPPAVFPLRLLEENSTNNRSDLSNHIENNTNFESCTQLDKCNYQIGVAGRHVWDFVLKPKRSNTADQGEISVNIKVQNLNDIADSDNVVVNYSIITPGIMFDRLQSGNLVLPSLIHPCTVETQSVGSWFSIKNASSTGSLFELEFLPSPEISTLFKFTLLLRHSGSPIISAMRLAPKETTDVKLVAVAVDNTRLSMSNEFVRLEHKSNLVIGTIKIFHKLQNNKDPQNEHENTFEDGIMVRGSIQEGDTFNLSTKHLHFIYTPESDFSGGGIQDFFSENIQEMTCDTQNIMTSRVGKQGSVRSLESVMTDTKCDNNYDEFTLVDNAYQETQYITPENLPPKKLQLVVSNLMKSAQLKLRVSIEYPVELSSVDNIISISPLDGDIACIDPNDSLTLNFTLMDTCIYGSSEDIKVCFIDCESLDKIPQYVCISTGESPMDS